MYIYREEDGVSPKEELLWIISPQSKGFAEAFQQLNVLTMCATKRVIYDN